MDNATIMKNFRDFKDEIMQCRTREEAKDLYNRLNAFCERHKIDNETRRRGLNGSGECLHMLMTMPDD